MHIYILKKSIIIVEEIIIDIRINEIMKIKEIIEIKRRYARIKIKTQRIKHFFSKLCEINRGKEQQNENSRKKECIRD